MTDQDTVYLKVTISREVSRRLKVYVANKYPDLLRGPLSEEVERALVQYLDSSSKNNNNNNNLQNTHAHTEKQQQQNNNNNNINNNINTKYKKLIETIKKYSNSQRQISSGLAKKAIQQMIGKDKRTVDKYLKILQEEDIIYGNSLDGMYDVQSWVFGDSINLPSSSSKQQSKHYQQQDQQITINNNNNNNSWSRI